MVEKSQTDEKPCVLVVDDDEDVKLMISEILGMEGFKVRVASDSTEACYMLQQWPVSLVLLDWFLVTEGGSETGSRVLATCKEIDPLLPVVVISGTWVDVKTDALIQGAVSFLGKPFTPSLVIAHVRNLIQRYSAAKSRFSVSSVQDIVPLEEAKQAYVRSVIRLLNGNLSEAAKCLGVHRQTVKAILDGSDNVQLHAERVGGGNKP